MNETESRHIGRAGGDADEPSFAPVPISPAKESSSASAHTPPLGRAGGEDDEPTPPPSGAPLQIATAAPDEIVELPAPPRPRDASAASRGAGHWGWAATGLAFSGTVIWLAIKGAWLVRTSLALPLVFRIPALAVESAAIAVSAFWIVRIAGIFVSFRKRSDRDMPSYYRRIGASGAFALEYPEERRKRALEAVRNLSVRPVGMTREWESRAREFEADRKAVAERIVQTHSLLTAVKTATSPWKIVDVMAVFYNSTRMVERLARLYGQRCTGVQAFRLVCRWGFNLYVAGGLGEVMERGSDMTVEKATELLENTGGGPSWLGNVLPMAGKIFAKAGEGAANYYLCRRLGAAAIGAFRPALDSYKTSCSCSP